MSDLLFDPRSNAQRLDDLLIALDTADLPRDRREAARALVLGAQRPTITWASPRPGVHLINGQHVDSDLLGLMAAHLAFLSPWRRVVRAADLAGPGAVRPENTVRNALRVAARFLGPLSMRAAAAVRLVKVEDGFAVYRPDGRWDIDAI